jgi:hypothetical protein
MILTHENRIIARGVDGSVVKGTTLDFFPTKDKFHVIDGSGDVKEIKLSSLKAVFFVKDFDGDPDYSEKKGFFVNQSQGKKVMVEFHDGELLFGYTLSYSKRGFGFFMFPGDPECNNNKVFIVHSATRRVKVKLVQSDQSPQLK